MQDLFRTEALEASVRPQFGSMLEARQPPWRVVLALLGVAALVASFAAMASWRDTVHARGLLLPAGGLVGLPSPVAGTVVAVHAAQGEGVARGQPLFELSTEPLDADVATSRDERARLLELALRQAAEAVADETRAHERRERRLRAELDSLREGAVALQGRRQLLAQRTELQRSKLPGLRQLADKGLVATFQMKEYESALLALQSEQQALAQQQGALQRQVDGVEVQLQDLPGELRRMQAGHLQRREELARELRELSRERSTTVRAQADGIVATVLVQPGSAVAEQQELATVAPRGGGLQAVLMVPSSAPAELQPGNEAVLRLPSFPYQRYGHLRGSVVEVSGSPVAADELARSGLPVAPGVAMYRVVVELAVDAGPAGSGRAVLRPGMVVEADLVIGRRRLVASLLAPVADAAARWSQP